MTAGKALAQADVDGRTSRQAGVIAYGVLNLMDLPPSRVIDNCYEIREKLGQGGFGAIFRAFDRNMELDRIRSLEGGDVAFRFTWLWPTILLDIEGHTRQGLALINKTVRSIT